MHGTIGNSGFRIRRSMTRIQEIAHSRTTIRDVDVIISYIDFR